MFFRIIMIASQSPGGCRGHIGMSTGRATGILLNVGAVLDVSLGMTTITTAVARASRRKLANPPLPEWEISGSLARKAPRRVLVVDDEPLIRWSVAETLSGIGLDVEQASDAASALAIMTTGPLKFDVIVLDLRLPDMHDLSLLATMRQLQPAASIVLMTAFGTDEIIERAIGLGAGSVLHKPFELGSLVDAVYGVSA
jgi:CheY-like chemotaxis protein